jgi:hypothetical protein
MAGGFSMSKAKRFHVDRQYSLGPLVYRRSARRQGADMTPKAHQGLRVGLAPLPPLCVQIGRHDREPGPAAPRLYLRGFA